MNTDKNYEHIIEELREKLNTEMQRSMFLENGLYREKETAKYYLEQLIDAHAIIGRLIHQFSEVRESVNLSKHFPTDNRLHHRTFVNPKGESGGDNV